MVASTFLSSLAVFSVTFEMPVTAVGRSGALFNSGTERRRHLK
jgi:hypothetical protein